MSLKTAGTIAARAVLYAWGAVLLIAILLSAGCASAPKKLDLPEATKVEHTETRRDVYVRVDPVLTSHPANIPSGPLDQVIEVAQARGSALQACYAKLDAIAEIQGTPAKPEGKKP